MAVAVLMLVVICVCQIFLGFDHGFVQVATFIQSLNSIIFSFKTTTYVLACSLVQVLLVLQLITLIASLQNLMAELLGKLEGRLGGLCLICQMLHLS